MEFEVEITAVIAKDTDSGMFNLVWFCEERIIHHSQHITKEEAEAVCLSTGEGL